MPHSKLHEWVDTAAAANAGIEILRRFSGGGTVVVDDATLFATLVMGREALPSVEPFPRPIMAWTEGLYAHVFKHADPKHGAFALCDNGTANTRVIQPATLKPQTMSLARASLAATRRPSPGGDGCTTPPFCGTMSHGEWHSSRHRPEAPSTARLCILYILHVEKTLHTVWQGRAHGDFLVRLKDVVDSRQEVLLGVRCALQRLGFEVQV